MEKWIFVDFFNKNVNVDNELNQKKDTFFNDIAIFLYLIIGSKIHSQKRRKTWKKKDLKPGL